MNTNNSTESKQGKKRTWIQYGEKRLQEKLLRLTKENKRLRHLVYQAYPNLLRKLPKSLMNLVISFLDKRLLDCIIVDAQCGRYIIIRNELRPEHYFDIYKGWSIKPQTLIKKMRSIGQVLCAFEDMRWKWHSGRDWSKPRPHKTDYESLTRNDLLVLGQKRCDPSVFKPKLLGPCKYEFLKNRDQTKIEMCLGLDLQVPQRKCKKKTNKKSFKKYISFFVIMMYAKLQLVCVLSLLALIIVILSVLTFITWPWITVIPHQLTPCKTYGMIVSAYKENIEWLQEYKNRFDIFLYAKHIDMATKHPEAILLPNVGRCDHTYLHHIVEHYDHLPDIVVFLTASTNKVYRKRKTLQSIILPRLGSRFNCLGHTSFLDAQFQLNEYETATLENRGGDKHCQPASIRPFSKWFQTRFPHLSLPFYSMYGGIFACTRKAICNVPKKIWIDLREELSVGDNLEVCHYMERSWFQLLTCSKKWDESNEESNN